jgi:putative membrane protein (TIGR04086 family)
VLARVLRSAAVILAGYVVFVVSAVALFQLSGRNPHAAQPPWFVAASAAYGAGFAALGGWLAARLAPARPLPHGVAVGLILAAGATVSLLTSPSADATWSQWTALTLMAPAALLGGHLAARTGRRQG